MMCWEGKGADGWLVVAAILLGWMIAHLMEHGIPAFPDPVNILAILFLAGCGIVALIAARGWR